MLWRSGSPLLRAGRIAVAIGVTAALAAEPRVVRAAPAGDLPGVEDEPEPAPAGDANRERAMAAFSSGMEHYNNARYNEALNDFLEAASLFAAPEFQYNIGACYENLDKPEDAIRAFETYLKAKPDAPDRANVEARIERLRKRVQTGQTGGPKAPADMKDPSAKDKGKKDNGRKLVIAGAVLTGVGAAVGLAGGIGFGVAARARSNELDDIQTGGNPSGATFAEAEDIEQRGKRSEVLQIAFAAAGSAIGITGIVLLAIGLKRRKGGTKRASLVPQLSPGFAGVGLSGRF